MGSILQWRVSTTSMLLYLLLQAWLLGSSFSSADFLTPVPDHGNATMADLCQKDTVMSCDLVMIDVARLHDSSVDFMGTTLDFRTCLVTTPTPSPPGFQRPASPWTLILGSSGAMSNWKTAETSSSSQASTSAKAVMWSSKRTRTQSPQTTLNFYHHQLMSMRRCGQMLHFF